MSTGEALYFTEEATLSRHEDYYGDYSWSDYRAGLLDSSKCVYGGVARNLRAGEREEKPLRIMRRDEFSDRSFTERCYIFFRNYVSDVEHGRIVVSDHSYIQAVKLWEYYREKFYETI